MIYYIFSILVFIPIYFFSRKYLNINMSFFISFLITFVNFILHWEFRNSNTIILTFLVSCFLYFFSDIDKKKNYYFSLLLIIILLFMKIIFIFMIPFLILWLIKQQKKILFYLISLITALILLFSINILNNGFSIKGILGNYSTIFVLNHSNFSFLEIYPNILPYKFFSLFISISVFQVFTFFLYFLLGYILIKYRKNILKKYIDKKSLQYYKCLIFNLVIFFFYPVILWNRTYLIYRYILYFFPIYFVFALSIFIILLNWGENNKCKKH